MQKDSLPAENIYVDMSNHDYHSGPGVSKSGLDLIAKSPLHYWSAYLDPGREPRTETPAMRLGTAIHTAILEPETWDASFVVLPEGLDRRTKAGKELYEAYLLECEAKGATILPQADAETALKIADNVRKHPLAAQLLRDGKAEQSLFWTDEETGVLCKCRPDWLLGGDNPAILDVKSTTDASPEGFMRSAYSWRYHVQAAWYLDGVEAATGLKPDAFMFLAIEKEPPYASAFYYADEDMITAGRAEYRKQLRTYAECTASNQWPGYASRLVPLSLPKWAQMLAEA